MKVIIFDFDGTIADSFATFVDVMHTLDGRVHESQRVPPEVIERMRGMSLHEAAKAVHFPVWKIPFILRKGLRLFRAQLVDVQPAPGIIEAILQLKAEGHELFIMSTNDVVNIKPYLDRHGLGEAFSKIYGKVGVFGKARVFKRIMKLNKLAAADIIYVGDEVRDIIAAKKAGVRIVSVTWGYNNQEILSKYKPDAVVATAPELLTALKAKV